MSETRLELLTMLVMTFGIACTVAGIVCSSTIHAILGNPLTVALLVAGVVACVWIVTRGTARAIESRRQPDIWIESPNRQRLPISRIFRLTRGNDDDINV